MLCVLIVVPFGCFGVNWLSKLVQQKRKAAMKSDQTRLNNPDRRSLLKGAAAVGISFSVPPALLAADGKLNFYNWDTYIGEDTISQFESSSGVSVQYLSLIHI